jgi:hypothetical protein
LRRNPSAAHRGARKTSIPPLPLPHSGEHTGSRRHQGYNERRGRGGRFCRPRHNTDTFRQCAGHRHRLISNRGDRTIAAPGNNKCEGKARAPRSTQSTGPPGGRDGGASGRPPGGRRGTPPNATSNAPLQGGGGGRPAPAGRRGPAGTCDHRGQSTTLPRPAGRRGGRSSRVVVVAVIAYTARCLSLINLSGAASTRHATEGRRPHEARAGG